MTDYSKMSDLEINMAIARTFYPNDIVIESKSRPPSACITGHPSRWVDYCNNEVDAWPIIVENSITIINDKNCFPRATNDSFLFINDQFDDCIHWCDRNPLKAAMIVFLMMQESKNAKIPSERDS